MGHSDTNQDTSCSAWTWIKAGLQPMIYNYPLSAHDEFDFKVHNMQHGVGIVLKAEDWFPATVKAHVVDGDTWSRKPAGIDVDCGGVCAPWTYGTFGDDFLDDGTKSYTCVLVDDDANPISCDDDGRYAAVGEDGSKWIERFTYDDSGSGVMDKTTTMQGQCQFETLSDSDTGGAFTNALGK